MSDGQSGAVASLQETLAGALAPEFEILRPLGMGQLGVVFLARETALRRLVAIKVPRPELAGDTVVHRRFEREARAAARLSHANIVAVHRVGLLPDAIPYLVMAYVEGPTLADALKAEGALPQDVAIEVLAQLAGALATAHEQGVVHRDVRPGNIIWQAEQRHAVLTDFGLAGILETGTEAVTQLTQPGQLLGDPAHISPERLLGEPLTPATDIYGLGVLGYEVLTLQEPYRVSSNRERAAAHLRQAPRDLAELLPSVDKRLADLLVHCLAKRPEHRPRAAELQRRLGRLDVRRTREAAREEGEDGDSLHGIGAAVEQLPALRAFLGELKKRRVYNVAALYLSAAIALLAFFPDILQGLNAPPWIFRTILAVTLLGFPVALVLAWLFDLTAAGVRRAAPDDQVMSSFPLRLLQGIALAVSILVSGLLGWLVISRGAGGSGP
ncbi:MAG: serine/threonine protein kinase [Gemmatimonadetes bacterium]|nr:serine/threonine protein kinase [Gemmatimonadota bacterium]